MNEPSKAALLTQTILRLTHEDQLSWELGTHSFYVAHYNGKTFKLCCNEKDALFLVDDERYNIGKKAVMLLCNAITNQTIRRNQDVEKINELNDWFELTTNNPT